MLTILNSGQTGVERGAYLVARAYGVRLAGFMPMNERDEIGRLPDHLRHVLTPCEEKGPRLAQLATIKMASGVVLAVPNRAHPERSPAMNRLITAARSASVPLLLVDPPSDVEEVAAFVASVASTSGLRRIYITGPRATRWNDGQNFARRIVLSIVMLTSSAVH